ncbi:M20/M25/M40 family metallo-hydrolase [Geomicrobium sp. JSM 1781026]|uniref:M20/M25/M40 family metallo-hydrolase n=1 Tax=Geomicrobium sp. JSM 1781026 TaxID=3344580 RepID=UPI0035C0642C
MAQYEQVYHALMNNNDVKQMLSSINADDKNTLDEQITIAQIPAPPFSEHERADYIKKCLEELGLLDVRKDEEGNVYGRRKGAGNGPTLFVSAHIDSVFSKDTDTTVSEKDGIYYGPGITDDARGLAALLTIVRAFQQSAIETTGDIIFGGTVGEEGPGDLRGVKAFFKDNRDIDGFISIDAVSPTEIIYNGTGSFRYIVTYKGPGGHSFGAFGTPSAVHAAARATVKLADLEPSTDPKTTFNVGVFEGGTIPTAIAEEAKLAIDLRSNGEPELDSIEQTMFRFLQEAADEENRKWAFSSEEGVGYTIEQIGDRPVGSQSSSTEIVETAWYATEALALAPSLAPPASTDSNYPMSIGVPSITLGAGGQAGGAHTLLEWYRPEKGYLGPQRVLLTILGLVGTVGNSPTLRKRT